MNFQQFTASDYSLNCLKPVTIVCPMLGINLHTRHANSNDRSYRNGRTMSEVQGCEEGCTKPIGLILSQRIHKFKPFQMLIKLIVKSIAKSTGLRGWLI